ncbi:hypothetical protein SK128_009855 [Halocaridina rubra]|uniref:DNA-directed RNA polymerase n=1 Tax=Halocaridina rubra TaxID=373956 RepID=A0AAN8X6R2_HALRR
MAPVFCLCKFPLPNARYGIQLFRLDSGVALKQDWKYLLYYNGLNGSFRHQSTKTSSISSGFRAKHRSKKKTLVDIIRVKEESALEGKAAVTRINQHSFDHTLGTVPTTASVSFLKAAKNQKAEGLLTNGVELGERVPLNIFSNLPKNLYEETFLNHHDISEVVRWNRGLTHTYDANYVINDSPYEVERVLIDDSHNDRNENEHRKLEELGSSDLSLLSSPLAGFGSVDKRDSKLLSHSESSPVVKDSPNAKKNVISSKNKISNMKSVSAKKEVTKKSAVAMKTKKKLKAELAKDLLERNNASIKCGIGSSRVDDCLIDAINDAVVIEDPQKDPKGKTKKGASARVFSKKMKLEQQFKEMIDIKKQCREVIFNDTLEAYLGVCVNVGLLNRALHTLLYYHHMGALRSGKKISSVKPYNIILHGLALKGSYDKMEELRILMEQDNIPLDENSFAAFLLCLGHQPMSFINTQDIENVLKIIERSNVDLHEVFMKVPYTLNSYDIALKAVRRIIRNFEPRQDSNDPTYNCNLVSELNDTIYSSRVRSPVTGLATEQELEKWTEEQLSCEVTGEITITSIENKPETPEIMYYREKLAKWEARWKEAIHTTFIKKVDGMKKSVSSNRHNREINLLPYLVCLPPEYYVSILIQELNRFASGSEGYSASRYSLYRTLGSNVYQRYLILCKREMGILKVQKSLYKKYRSWLLSDCFGDGVSYIPRVHWQNLSASHKGISNLSPLIVEWPNSVLLAVGQFLYSILLRNVMVWKPLHSEKHVYPALYEIDRSYDYRVIEEIKPAPILMEIYRRAARPTLTFPSYVAPMTVPPLPWTSPSSGGYLVNSSHVVRLPYNAQKQKQLMDDCEEGQLFPVLDSLNQLGTVPWCVNKEMLDLIIEIFNNKGWEEMDIPPPPSECQLPPKIKSSMSTLEKKQAMRKRLDYNKKKSEMHSLWCDALYKLSFANHFRDRIFWFPHNMDFRGRVYPLPPHINHMSSDVFRSILCFARGERLGPNGLKWLKLHLINLTGIVKRESVDDRLKYLDTIMDEVFDSADNPLSGNKWWTKSDEPWQTLAACKELASALRSGNPEEYVSQLPIHQDGSCNGLQHYAALGRDVAGAVSVNLSPRRTPQDVYSSVVELVEQERRKDALAGKEIAKALEGFVHRKVIKQTVMTTVYGVTRFGARLQIERQLKDLNFPPTKTWRASHYLVQKTFHSLEQMFSSAKEIQDWFTECARMVSRTCQQNMEWVTPLGLPVVQHYTVPLTEKCPIMKMGMTVNIDSVMQPNTMKQKNAFPPNFIHSLDSSHMMLTSIYSQRADITFVSVHDCFWTHAASVDVMNKICREQFVALHKEPILENLSSYLQKKFRFEYDDFDHDGSAHDYSKLKLNSLLRRVPPKGDFDINKVLESVYFFS